MRFFKLKKAREEELTERDERCKKLFQEIAKISQLVEKSSSDPVLKGTPDFIENGELRDYQLTGVNWLLSLYENGVHGILADEMGLGKTLQTICFLGYLKHIKKVEETHLIIVPKSTITNWGTEFQKWCPSLSYYIHQISSNVASTFSRVERQRKLREVFVNNNYDVIITTSEVYMQDKRYFNSPKRSFCYLILDEGHRIKNSETVLFTMLQEKFTSKYRLLLTGTPIQNNLEELWSLLNFLMPEIFNSRTDFNVWFSLDNCLSNDDVTHNLQNIIKPIVLQRLKSSVTPDILPKIILDVYVPLTSMQQNMYRSALLHELYDLRLGTMNNKKLQNMLAQLRKACLHPYLFHGAENGPPYTTDQHILNNSGKMFFLDKMLNALYKNNSRVLIFSQMTRVLDIIEDYCCWRKYSYLRLDGKTNTESRVAGMNEFNSKDSNVFIYMLSTRAGGLGINLHTADTVIFYDIDWNPQVDLQAMDRAHRIGQKKQLRVYRLITENTLEEKMLERANLKMLLNERVIRQKNITPDSKDSLLECLRFCAEYQINCTDAVDLKNFKINIRQLMEQGYPKRHQVNNDNNNNNNNNDNNNNMFETKTLKRRRSLRSHEWLKERENDDYRFYSKELKDLLNRRNSKRTKVLSDEESSKLNNLLRDSFVNWSQEDFRAYLVALETFGVNNTQRVYENVLGKTVQEVKAYSKVFWERIHELPDHEDILRKIPNAK